VETLAGHTILCKRYGVVPAADAKPAARAIETEAFDVVAAAGGAAVLLQGGEPPPPRLCQVLLQGGEPPPPQLCQAAAESSHLSSHVFIS
jgi:hypothetical protein